MTLHEMLRFSGSVLGPALVAQAVADALRAVPGYEPLSSARLAADVDRLLRQALPNGLDL
jgi:hypothetical protein